MSHQNTTRIVKSFLVMAEILLSTIFQRFVVSVWLCKDFYSRSIFILVLGVSWSPVFLGTLTLWEKYLFVLLEKNVLCSSRFCFSASYLIIGYKWCYKWRVSTLHEHNFANSYPTLKVLSCIYFSISFLFTF